MLTISKALWVASLVAQCALLVRLVAEGLARRAFPLFTAYVSWGILSGLVLIWIPFNSTTYAHAWLICEPFFVVLGFATLWECYRRGLDAHSPRDRYFVFALAGALALSFSLFSLSLEFHSLHHISPYLWVILFDRIEASGTALFLGGLWFVFRQFPILRNANTGHHWFLLFLFGTLNSIAFTTIAISAARLVNVGNIIAQTSSLILYSVWAWKLSAVGEIEEAQPMLVEPPSALTPPPSP